MHIATFVPLLAGLSSLAAAAPFAGQILGEDDIVLLGASERREVMKIKDYEVLKARSLPAAQWVNTTFPTLDRRAVNYTRPISLERRQCEESQEVQVAEKTNFANWDVPMSSVLQNAADRSYVAVQDGFSLSNSLSVSVGTEASFESVLSVSLGVKFGTSWTTSQQTEYRFYLPAGKNGLIVSNPDTTRYTGVILSGCTDNPEKVDFTVDSYTSASYGELSWVKGTIRLCASDQYPVPFCVGTGSHS